MIPTIAKRWINSVDFNVVFKVEKGKNWTWTVPHERFVDPVKTIMLFDFESLHLPQPYIKSINFPRDEGENKKNMLSFVLECSTPLKNLLFHFGSCDPVNIIHSVIVFNV